MDLTRIIGRLLGVMDTLEKVEVHGRNNMKRLSACVDYLEGLTEELKGLAPDQEEAANGDNS